MSEPTHTWFQAHDEIARLRVLLVECDREIKRLQASVNEQLARANERTVAAEDQLAACQFSDAERKALLRDPLLLNAEIRRLDLVILKRDREIDRLQAELDEDVAHWKRQLAAMDDAAAELRSHRDELKALLVERDKEIERLQDEIGREADRANYAEREWGRLAERRFTDAERKALLKLTDWIPCSGTPVQISARVKLEQGQ